MIHAECWAKLTGWVKHTMYHHPRIFQHHKSCSIRNMLLLRGTVLAHHTGVWPNVMLE